MSTFYRCDNCEKEEPALVALVHEKKNTNFDVHLRTPAGWFSKFDGHRVLDVCSAECGVLFDEKDYKQAHLDGEENDDGNSRRGIRGLGNSNGTRGDVGASAGATASGDGNSDQGTQEDS